MSVTPGQLISVGKTSLIERYVKKHFAENYRITVGADLFSVNLEIDGKAVTLQV